MKFILLPIASIVTIAYVLAPLIETVRAAFRILTTALGVAG